MSLLLLFVMSEILQPLALRRRTRMHLSLVGKPWTEYLPNVSLWRWYQMSSFCLDKWWSMSMCISDCMLKKDLTFLFSSKVLPKFVPRILECVIVKLLNVFGL